MHRKVHIAMLISGLRDLGGYSLQSTGKEIVEGISVDNREYC
jgi:hypothetical protein